MISPLLKLSKKAALVGALGFLATFLAGAPSAAAWQGAFKIGGLQTPFGPDDLFRFDGPGKPATATRMQPSDLAPRSDGSILVAAANDRRVLLIGRDGRVSVLAGTGVPGLSGDGGPAIHARLLAPGFVALLSNGGFAISDLVRVREVDRRGVIRTTVGGGSAAYRDGALARSVSFVHDRLGPLIQLADGTLVIGATDQVFEVDRHGRIHTLVKLGQFYGEGAGDYLREVDHFALRGRSLLASDGFDGSVWRLALGRKPARIAGNGQCNEVSAPCPGSAGDGRPATKAPLPGPDGLAVTKDGSILIAESTASRIRRVAPDGTISTLFPNPRIANFVFPTPTETLGVASDGSVVFTGYHTVNILSAPTTDRLAISLTRPVFIRPGPVPVSIKYASTLTADATIKVVRPRPPHTTITIRRTLQPQVHTLTFPLPLGPGSYHLTLTARTPDHQVATAYALLIVKSP